MKETLALLLQTERRLLSHARELRLARQLLEKEFNSKGALGSRGLTQFLLDQLEQASSTPTLASSGIRVSELQRRAGAAGYAVPNSVSLTKRLSEFRARTGKVAFDRSFGWYWTGKKDEEEG